MEVLIFALVSVGIVNILQNESIFSFLREFLYKKYPKLYNYLICPSCFGFAIGVLLSFFFTIYPIFLLDMFFCGVISSILNKIYSKLSNDFGQI